jgi:hypothetical protein
VKATITDADGKVVATKDNVGRAAQFPLKREDATKDEVWSIMLEKPNQGVLEDVNLQLAGVPALLFSGPDAVYRPIPKQP